MVGDSLSNLLGEAGILRSTNKFVQEEESSCGRLCWLLGASVREQRLFESDLLVPFCLQEKSDKGRIREHACISRFGISLCKGEACVPCSYPSQATNSPVLSRAPREYGSLAETALHLPSAWNAHRPCQREVPTACRKRVVTAATRHSASASQTTGLPEDRPVSPGAAGQDGSDLGTGSLHCPS